MAANIRFGKKIEVMISQEAWRDMQMIVALSDKEVGWLGEVTQFENKDEIVYLLETIHVPIQQVHAATCELDAADQSRIAMELKAPEKLKLWGHSHVNMPTSPSGQDLSEFKERCNITNDFSIMLIINKKDAVTAYIYNKMYNITVEDVAVSVIYKGTKTRPEWEKELKKKVLPIVIQIPKSQAIIHNVEDSYNSYMNGHGYQSEEYLTNKQKQLINKEMSHCTSCYLQVKTKSLKKNKFGNLICPKCMKLQEQNLDTSEYLKSRFGVV